MIFALVSTREKVSHCQCIVNQHGLLLSTILEGNVDWLEKLRTSQLYRYWHLLDPCGIMNIYTARRA